VTAMCKALKASRSFFYEWCARVPDPQDPLLREAIRAVQREADRSYGYRRMVPELRSQGLPCGTRMVRRLMREEGLQGRMKRTKPYGSPKKQEVVPVPNVLGRQFLVEAPNRVWVSDITYIWTRAGWTYLAVVLDLYSRMVVGWSVSRTPDTALVLAALMMAVNRRGPGRGVQMHTDQGCQYTSKAWREALEAMGFTLSMSGRGQCWDNAPMESWNGSLKRESSVVRILKDDEDEVKDVLFLWIEGWYNTRRRHSGIGYDSPAAYEQKWAA